MNYSAALLLLAFLFSNVSAGAAGQRYDHGEPTAHEQFMLEMINRARAEPEAEALRLGIELNTGLPEATISPDPKPPLAFHPALIAAARGHSDWMLAVDLFQHEGENGSTPGARMSAAGYPFRPPSGWGENVGWRGTTGTIQPTTFAASIQENLFRSPSHRRNLMNSFFQEIGLGILEGRFTASEREYNAVMVTQKFARSADTPGLFLLGVIYRDADRDGFYSPGEGVGGVTVNVERQSYFAISSAAGGFAVPVQAGAGRVTVTLSGGSPAVAISRVVEIGNVNLKVDFELSSAGRVQMDSATARRLPGGAFEVDLIGAPGQSYRMESSTDLVDWRMLQTGVLPAPRFTFRDDTASGQLNFYRVITP